MSLNSQYRALQEFVQQHTWKNKDIFFTSNALTGELGELCNVIKKEIAIKDFIMAHEMYTRKVANGDPTFQEQFVDEAGDVLFYYVQLLNKKGVTMEEVISEQVKKIQNQSDEAGKPYLK